MENAVEVVCGQEKFAVLVRACHLTHAVDTMLFEDVEAAQLYCRARWCIPLDAWEVYLVQPDMESPLKLNSDGVAYCGWKHDRDETEVLYIHLERKVVEF